MAQDIFNEQEQPRLTTTLKVLTILTIIGCVFQLLAIAYNFFQAKENYANKDKILAQINSGDVPSFVKKMMPDPELYDKMVTLSYNNRLPIFLLSLVATILCFVGALQMRKLKKQGLTLYLTGTIVPFITQALFIGFFVFVGLGAYFTIAVTLLFVGLYLSQRKNLVY